MTDSTIFIPSTISKRITAIRYLGILGVVFCHAIQNPFYFLHGEFFANSVWYEGFINDNAIRWLHSIGIYGLTYGAVPMFFIFSGFLQFGKSRNYESAVSHRIQSLVQPFIFWTIFNVAVLFFLKFAVGIVFSPQLLSSTDWHVWLNAFVGNYSNAWIRGTHCPSIMYQFWFIRDLFVLTLISPAIGFLMREQKYCLPSLIIFGVILANGYRPIIVGGDSLFYFSLGAFFACHKIDFLSPLDRYWKWWASILLSVCGILWMYLKYDGNPDPDTPMWVQLSSTLLLLKASCIIIKSEKTFKIAKSLDEQAFFLYCAHAPVSISLCSFAAYYALPDTASSIIVVATIIIGGFFNAAICTGIGLFLKRFCPRVFAVMTGGRTTAVKR